MFVFVSSHFYFLVEFAASEQKEFLIIVSYSEKYILLLSKNPT